MTSLPCDIVLLPSDEIAQHAITVSNVLKNSDSFFTLKMGEYFPHASVYMTQLKTEDLEEVELRLSAIAKSLPAIPVRVKGYEQELGYIGVSYKRNDLLDRIQQEVVEAINPIRDGLRPKDAQRLESAVGEARKNLERYGYRAIGELFDPHITLTRSKITDAIDTQHLETYLDSFNGYFTKLGLFEMGDNGTCVRKIAEFELGGAK